MTQSKSIPLDTEVVLVVGLRPSQLALLAQWRDWRSKWTNLLKELKETLAAIAS